MNSADTFILGEVIAHLRTYTDIPYVREIARLANTELIYREFETKRKDIAELAARYEVRFKSVTAIIRYCGNSYILEIASGLSGRGMDFTSEPNIVYVETDLPDVVACKRQIVERILGDKGLSRPNLYINPADALNFAELYQHTELLSRPLTIVCEGLLSNLAYSELCDVMANVLRLLSECGGVFITPDFFNSEQRKESLADNGGAYTFKSDDEIFEFIKISGFSFERYLQSEFVPYISCALAFDRIEVGRQLKNRYVYKLVVK
jgi:O-methyltransferase involved in polyketide biosynthesis